MSEISRKTLDCGIPLVVEQVESAASAALHWLVPAGSATDPGDRVGLTTLLSELILRGAGEFDSRALSDAFDLLGVRRASHLATHHLHLQATMLGRNVPGAVPLLTSLVLAPQLPDEALDSVRNLCVQSLDSLNDDPQHQVMLLLRKRHRAAPFNRSGYGERDVLRKATIEDLRDVWTRRFRPGGSILTAAGAVDADFLVDRLNTLLAGFEGVADEPDVNRQSMRGYEPVEQATAQVHIGIAFDAPAEPEPESVFEHVANAVLSGGTSGRLFTEVRQRRSLCYSVGASYRAGRDTGAVSIYAGTTPERAQETVDVTIEQVQRMAEGVTRAEYERAVTRLKSRLVMQGESTRARAASLASDQFRLGRPRTLDERVAAIESVTLDALNNYLSTRQIGPFTMTSIGPGALTPPDVSAAVATSS